MRPPFPAATLARRPPGAPATTRASSDLAHSADGLADSTGPRSVTGATGTGPGPPTSTGREPVWVRVPPYHCVR